MYNWATTIHINIVISITSSSWYVTIFKRPNLTLLTASFKVSDVPTKKGRTSTNIILADAFPATTNDLYGYQRELDPGLLGALTSEPRMIFFLEQENNDWEKVKLAISLCKYLVTD